jgi:hypothetical protein
MQFVGKIRSGDRYVVWNIFSGINSLPQEIRNSVGPDSSGKTSVQALNLFGELTGPFGNEFPPQNFTVQQSLWDRIHPGRRWCRRSTSSVNSPAHSGMNSPTELHSSTILVGPDSSVKTLVQALNLFGELTGPFGNEFPPTGNPQSLWDRIHPGKRRCRRLTFSVNSPAHSE